MDVFGSSCEAEYVAKLLPDYEILVEIWTDNESNEQIINGTAPVRRLRHVDAAYHRIQREVQKGTVTVNWIESEFNNSDMTTKPLSLQKHSYILKVNFTEHEVTIE
eukprot:Pgem_evm1s3578